MIELTTKMGKVDDIIFDKPTITIGDYPEIMWKTITTDKYVKRRRITVTIMVSISTTEEDVEEEAIDTWREICRTKPVSYTHLTLPTTPYV